jgi:hypothetical protein
MIKHAIELIHGAGAKRITNLGAVKSHPSNLLGFTEVIGDITEVLKALDFAPKTGIKER